MRVKEKHTQCTQEAEVSSHMRLPTTALTVMGHKWSTDHTASCSLCNFYGCWLDRWDCEVWGSCYGRQKSGVSSCL